jgi:hypothetical protein
MRDQILAALTCKHREGEWHWLKWHFDSQSPLLGVIVDTILACEAKAAGSGVELAKTIGNLAGPVRNLPQYDQILQCFAEILVFNGLIEDEALAALSWQNEQRVPPSELRVDFVADGALGVEVKAPAFNEQHRVRSREWQFIARIPGGMELAEGLDVTLPRDNSVKDFLESANAKFAAFKAADPTFIGVLAIVWDDYIQEAITWLKGPNGLLTADSFHRDENDHAVIFEHVDAVVLLRHQTYFYTALGANAFDTRFLRTFLPGAWEGLPNVIFPMHGLDLALSNVGAAKRALGAAEWDTGEIPFAADYRPQELIMWIDLDDR